MNAVTAKLPPGATSREPDRTEESLVRSLAELRALELERQAEERAAIEAAAAARHRDREAAEQAVRDADAARVAAELAAQVAAQTARATAEREARLQIEAIEATERARRLVALEEHRNAEELAIRREAALRQRPGWLLALAAGAMAAAAVLAWLALDRHREASAAAEARDRALAGLAQVQGIADAAHQALDERDREIAALRRRIDEAGRRLAAAGAEHGDGRAGNAAPPPHPGPARPHPRDAVPRPPNRPLVISNDCLANALCDDAAKPSPLADPGARRK
ncbi:MAG TPA: hypothetical protein VGD37_31845 [Kofleriaceae bacterium]|jgi:hypothetical protein